MSKDNAERISLRPMHIFDFIAIHSLYNSLSNDSKRFFPSRILGTNSIGVYWIIAQVALLLSSIGPTNFLLRKTYSKAAFMMLLAFDTRECDKPIGLAYVRGPDAGNEFYLGIGVRDKYHGVGVGSLLMDALIKYAMKAGAKRIILGVNENNVRALSLYRRYGFKPINYPYMSLDLNY